MWLLPLQAHAAPATAVSASVKLEVVKLARQGKQHFNAKRYREALALWKKAYSLWPKPQLLFNIALAHARLGEPVEAMTFLQAYLREATAAKLGARLIAAANRLKQTLEPQIARLAVSGTTGARVLVDGKLVGTIPLAIVTRPGARTLEVKAAGWQTDRRQITLPAGTITRVIIQLVKPPPVTPPPRKRRVTPRPRLRRRPPVGPGPGTPVTPQEPGKGLHMAYALSTAGVALALAGAAIGTGLKALDVYDEFQASPTVANRDRVIRYRDATTALWVVAGAAGATAVVLAIFTRWKPRRERSGGTRSTLQVVPGPGAFGLGVRGGF